MEKSFIGIKEIQEVIPHRYPMLLIDRIIDLKDGEYVIATKAVSYNEPFFSGHYPDRPIMPGVLIVEALAQAGAYALLSDQANKGKTPLFAGINKARFKRQVLPGDLLELKVQFADQRRGFGKGYGQAKVDGELACKCELLFYLD